MAHIAIHQRNAQAAAAEVLQLCPFGAIEVDGAGQFAIGAGCRMCRLCIKKLGGVFTLVEDRPAAVDKSRWRGIAVTAELSGGKLHPVGFELLGKARQMADKIQQPVYAVLIGHGVTEQAATLLEYGADEVYVYDDAELEHFRIEPYAAVLEDFIHAVEPAVVLVGGTQTGRALAPRLAARFRTGLTADCTVLDIHADTDLDQIRPAYGGNIMAHIQTPNHRPQFATVRYKIFPIPEKCVPHGRITPRQLPPDKLRSAITIVAVREKPAEVGIEDAEVLIVGGRGLRKAEDMAMLEELAGLLNGRVAATRALVEAGWCNARQQIGLSGRTVKPKLIITVGVSGAIQFVAGMNNSEWIVAINSDGEAPIFKNAHIAIHGDLYAIVPELIAKLKGY